MKDSKGFCTPAPVTISGLREYFKRAYLFDDAHAELMIRSAKKSLESGLAEAREALSRADSPEVLASAAHNLKGLLLNMGEAHWAQLAREVEQQALKGCDRQYGQMIEALAAGVKAVTEYDPETDG